MQYMKIERAVYLYIILVSLLSLAIFPVISHLLSDDVFYHLIVVREMINSKTPLIIHEPWFNAPEGVFHNRPPLFYWLMVLVSIGGVLNIEHVAIFFQFIFYPLALLTVYCLASYIDNKRVGLISVIILSTYLPFFARTHLCIPEALEHVMVPLALLYYLKGKEKTCGLFLLALFLNHSYYPFLVLFIIVSHWTLYKRRSYNLLSTLLIALPGISLQLYYRLHSIMGYVIMVTSMTTTGYVDCHNVSYAILCTAIILFVGLLSMWKSTHNQKNNILVMWFLSTIPILFLYHPARFPAYVASPLIIAIAMLIDDEINRYTGSWTYSRTIQGIAILLFINIIISTAFFTYAYDLATPALDDMEASALSWISENIPENQIILVPSGYGKCMSYRIVYYTNHGVTTIPSNSTCFYVASQELSNDDWVIYRRWGWYRIYKRDNCSV